MSFCTEAGTTARSPRSSKIVPPSAPTTAELHPFELAIARANAPCKFSHSRLRSSAVQTGNCAASKVRSAKGLLNLSATETGGLEAECACATSHTVPTANSREIANATRRLLRARKRRDLLLKPTVLFT